jgi:hypothetical protein
MTDATLGWDSTGRWTIRTDALPAGWSLVALGNRCFSNHPRLNQSVTILSAERR